MPFSIYQASVPVFLRGLDRLEFFLKKAEEHAAATGVTLESLAESRLAPDMHPLTFQVQATSDAAKAGGARLAGQKPPSFADTEKTFPELYERIKKTSDFLKSLDKAAFDDAAERAFTVKMGPEREVSFTGQSYLLGFALPNFYFHVTTAYAILRHKGVKLGKLDYLGSQ